MSSNLARQLAFGVALVAASAPAFAWDEIVAKRGWPIVAQADEEDCQAWALGNGKIFRISGSGLRPGEAVSFHLENGDMKPLDYRLVADGDGAWVKFYMPFRWNREGGEVTVSMESASCSLSLSFPWERQTGGYNSRLATIGY